MARSPNIFYKLVRDENSTTHLLCNLLRFAAFRRPFLALFLPRETADEIGFDSVQTQYHLRDFGRPDISIEDDRVCVLIEVKVERSSRLTENQPDG